MATSKNISGFVSQEEFDAMCAAYFAELDQEEALEKEREQRLAHGDDA